MLLGHASIATTERDAAVDDSEIRAADAVRDGVGLAYPIIGRTPTAIYVQVSDPKRVEAIDRLDPFGRQAP